MHCLGGEGRINLINIEIFIFSLFIAIAPRPRIMVGAQEMSNPIIKLLGKNPETKKG